MTRPAANSTWARAGESTTDAKMDWARPIIAGLVAAMVVAVLAALGVRAVPEKSGWRRVTPSPMHWTGVLLGTSLVLLMSWVRLFVGSTRADAESQMTILTWLILAFALGTIAVALSMVAIRRQALRWRGTRLAWRKSGRDCEADLSGVEGIGYNRLGQVVVTFEDGARLALDPYARGAQELIDAATARLDRPTLQGR